MWSGFARRKDKITGQKVVIRYLIQEVVSHGEWGGENVINSSSFLDKQQR